MAREVPITQKSVGITARVQETGGPLGGANLAKHVAGVALQKRDEVQNQVIENTYLKGQTVLTEDITKLEEKYGNNPEALTTALEEYSTSFLDEVSDPNMKARFELQITKGAQTSIARATAKHRARVNEQAKFDNLTALESLKNENYKISSDLLSGDMATQLAAAGQWQEASDRLAQVINATDSQGMPLFSAEYRAKEIAQHVDISLSTAGISYIEKAKDKQQALNEIKSGAKKIPFPDGNGGFEMVDLKEKIGKRAFDVLIRDAQAQIAQQKAQIGQQRQITNSQIELAIDTVQDDQPAPIDAIGPNLPTLNRGQKLGRLLQEIDNNPLYNDSPEGIVKGNNLRQKIYSKLEKEKEKADLINAGSAFASGDAFLNRQDTKAVSAANEYYKTIEPVLASLPSSERNAVITDLVNKQKFVPDRLTGDIQRVARSNDIEQISEVVDLIDRVSDENPHLINDLAPEKDIARLRMINNRINQGYMGEEALKIVDDLLDPRNEINIQEATAQLKEKNIDYRDKVLNAFDSSLLPFNLGIDLDSPTAVKQIEGLTATFRKSYEDHYRITRDESLSEEYAINFVKGVYGVSEVNGDKQIMQYAPENYYGIENEDSGWMREQMIDDALIATKNWLKASPDKYSRKDFKDNLVLMIDPKNTKRTASKNAPEYRLMYKTDNGSLIEVSDKPYFFDPDKRRKEIVKEKAIEKQVKELNSAQAVLLYEDFSNLKEAQKNSFKQSRETKIETITKKLNELGVEVE